MDILGVVVLSIFVLAAVISIVAFIISYRNQIERINSLQARVRTLEDEVFNFSGYDVGGDEDVF